MIERLARANWQIFVSRFAVVGSGFLSLLVIAALMPAADFGQFSHLWAITLTLSAIASMGGPAYHLREGTARLVDPTRGLTAAETVVLTALFPAALLAAISAGVTLLPGDAARFVGLDRDGNAAILFACSAAWSLNLLNHAIIPFRLAERTSFSMIVRDAGPQLILLVVAVTLFLMGSLSPLALVGAFFVSCLLLVAVLFAVYVWQHGSSGFQWREPETGRPSGLRNFWGSAVLGTVSGQSDILLGGLVLDNADLGQYQVLRRLSNLVGLPQIVANWVVGVRIGMAAAASDMNAVQKLCREAARLTIGPALVLAVAITIGMPFFIWLYDLPNTPDLWLAFAILILASLANIAGGVNFILAAQARKENFALLARLASLLIAVALASIVGSKLSSWSLSMVAFASVAVANILLWYLLRRAFKTDTSVFCLLRGRDA